jgi:hypothetical protein
MVLENNQVLEQEKIRLQGELAASVRFVFADTYKES